MNQPPVWEGSNKAPFFFGNNKRRYIISFQKLISSKYLKFWLSYEWFSDLCNILLPKQNQPFLSEKLWQVMILAITCNHQKLCIYFHRHLFYTKSLRNIYISTHHHSLLPSSFVLLVVTLIFLFFLFVSGELRMTCCSSI